MDIVLLVIIIVLIILLLVIYLIRHLPTENHKITKKEPINPPPVNNVNVHIQGKEQVHVLNIDIPIIYSRLALSKFIQIDLEADIIDQLINNSYRIKKNFLNDILYLVKYYESDLSVKSKEAQERFIQATNNFFIKVSSAELDKIKIVSFAYRIVCFFAIRLFSHPFINKSVLYNVLAASDNIEESKRYRLLFLTYAKALASFIRLPVIRSFVIKEGLLEGLKVLSPKKDMGLAVDKCFYQGGMVDFSKLSEYIYFLDHVQKFFVGFIQNPIFKEVYQITHHPRIPSTLFNIFDVRNNQSITSGINRFHLIDLTRPVRKGVEVLPGFAYLRFFSENDAFIVRTPYRSHNTNKLLRRNILTSLKYNPDIGLVTIQNRKYHLETVHTFVFAYESIGFFYQNIKFISEKTHIMTMYEFLVVDKNGVIVWRSFIPLADISYSHNLIDPRVSKNQTFIMFEMKYKRADIISQDWPEPIQQMKSLEKCIEKLQSTQYAGRFSTISNVRFHQKNSEFYLLDKTKIKLYFTDEHITTDTMYNSNSRAIFYPLEREFFETTRVKEVNNQLTINT